MPVMLTVRSASTVVATSSCCSLLLSRLVDFLAFLVCTCAKATNSAGGGHTARFLRAAELNQAVDVGYGLEDGGREAPLLHVSISQPSHDHVINGFLKKADLLTTRGRAFL